MVYSSHSQQSDRILVVDDAPDNLFLVQSILQDEGYIVEVADNGAKALDLIQKSPPQLVLLDVMMPGMDGFEVTRIIREQQKSETLPFIPILLITAYDEPSVARGLDIGADDFIRKPVEFDELLARVRSLIRLKHSVDERDEIARQREDFVSRLTHDLRTPLVAADRMLDLMQQGYLGELSEEMEEVVVTMASSNKNLLAMVNQLLEVYRYEAGRKSLNFRPTDLKEVAQEVLQALDPLAQEKSLQLILEEETPSDYSYVVQGDRLELNRIITNLVGNAIKFTDSGTVTVLLMGTAPGQSNSGQSNSIVKVTVNDTGPGIPPESQADLFQRFQQGRHGRSGSGLGLYLSHRIVEAHGGELSCLSEVGKGSSFTVKIPASQQANNMASRVSQ
ncbi:MAG: ATP-binding response regulator [Thainema sp.]